MWFLDFKLTLSLTALSTYPENSAPFLRCLVGVVPGAGGMYAICSCEKLICGVRSKSGSISFHTARGLIAAAAVRTADFNVEVARYELEAAQTTLEYSAATSSGVPAESVPVRSPIDGRILRVEHECEGPVRTGQPLLEVGDPNALEIEVDVLSADAVKIQAGIPVVFDRWGGEQPLGAAGGTVVVVSPALVVDQVDWTKEWGLLGLTALERSGDQKTSSSSTDPESWCLSDQALPNGGIGSPGAENGACGAEL